MRADRVMPTILGVMFFPMLLEADVYGWLIALISVFMIPWAFAWALFDDVDELKSNINRRVQLLKQEVERRR
ncbi:hypothetical protein PAP_07415 [Palaeococcus pacificus DY20341]|uniref:Uncharacterized protein n=1 Tax=Palaeococcus pacificus DY20341 TaxID=1343739 RepID=A0A075LZ85_9EURY|nr:hypothetical protein [Palaeococcus pacificus]AIF69873.1 hypothetical protein PAP_07415 [Palaeococcus pacificus DY20341]